MKAAVLASPGAATPQECFRIDPHYPKPTLPSPEWVLVRVYAAGLNRAELRGRNADEPAPPEFGIYQDEYHPDPPKILGEEFVGVVEEVGEESGEKFRKGDRVAAWVYGGGKAYDGAYAEFVIVKSLVLFHLPPGTEDLPWEVVGAVPMSMWTAYGSLFVAGETKPGATVLIHGGTSSVGLWAILLAKDKGCKVIATTRQEWKRKKLEEAGADHVLLEDELKDGLKKVASDGVDTCLELVGPDALTSVGLPLLARHGSVVVTGVLTKAWTIKDFEPAMIPSTRKITMYAPSTEDVPAQQKALEEVFKKVKSKDFKPEVFLDKVYSLEQIGDAHDHTEKNAAIGKVVVRIE